MNVTYRRAISADYEPMSRLVDANLRVNLQDTADGFLQGAFAPSLFAAMNEDACVISALDGDALLGFHCGQTVEFNRKHNIVVAVAMADRFEQVQFNGLPLSQYRICILGPVCVAKEARGQGIFEGMYREMIKETKERFNLGVSFVSIDNPRSLKAHVDKVGLQIIDNFAVNDRRFNALAIPLK